MSAAWTVNPTVGWIHCIHYLLSEIVPWRIGSQNKPELSPEMGLVYSLQEWGKI